MATPALAQLKKGGLERLKWGGDGIYFDIVTNAPVPGTFSQSGYFSTSANSVEVQGNIGIKRQYVTKQFDGLADYGTRSKEAAFIAIGRKMMREALDGAKLAQQFAVHGDGKGILGTVTGGSTIAPTVANPYGITSSGQGGLWIFPGMYVAGLNSTGATVRGRATVVTVTHSSDTATVTLDVLIPGLTTTDILVSCSPSDTAFNAVPNGFTNITNRDGSTYDTFEGQSAATYPRWDATQLVAGTDSVSTSEITEMDIWHSGAVVAGRSGKDIETSPDEFLMLTTPGLERKLAETFLAQRRFEAPLTTIKGGFKAIQVCGLSLVRDADCPAGTFYLLHLPSLFWVDGDDFSRVQYEDSGSVRFINGRDAFEWTIKSYWNIGAFQRNSHAIWTGFTDTARYSRVMG